MEKYRVRLAEWSECRTKYLCPKCGKKTFVKYIDTQTYSFISNEVGKCDRKFECGYHSPPREYFKNNNYYPEPYKSAVDIKQVPFNIQLRNSIDIQLLYETLDKPKGNKLLKFFYQKFNSYAVDQLINDYCIGTSDKWQGATLFWQIDEAKSPYR